MKLFALTALLALAACSAMPTGPANPPGTNANTVEGIQKSCDDPNAEITYINGHEYMCGDKAMVQQSIQELIRQVQRATAAQLRGQHGA